MTSKLFFHPISGEHQGSTCVCGLYRVGGGQELCDDCRSKDEFVQLKAQIAQLKAEVDQLRSDNVSLTEQMKTRSDNSLMAFKAMMAEIWKRDSAIYE